MATNSQQRSKRYRTNYMKEHFRQVLCSWAVYRELGGPIPSQIIWQKTDFWSACWTGSEEWIRCTKCLTEFKMLTTGRENNRNSKTQMRSLNSCQWPKRRLTVWSREVNIETCSKEDERHFGSSIINTISKTIFPLCVFILENSMHWFFVFIGGSW